MNNTGYWSFNFIFDFVGFNAVQHIAWGDGIAVGDIGRFESELLARIKSSNAGLLDGIRAKKDLTAELEAELKSVLDAFLKTFA
jgi:F0F1-type ATP synthase alpha subunit